MAAVDYRVGLGVDFFLGDPDLSNFQLGEETVYTFTSTLTEKFSCHVCFC